jgi:hypothetical protein
MPILFLYFLFSYYLVPAAAACVKHSAQVERIHCQAFFFTMELDLARRISRIISRQTYGIGYDYLDIVLEICLLMKYRTVHVPQCTVVNAVKPNKRQFI